mmetsp:Transcript_7832/g.17889  ORF Transcript_7832/g.17889 Transcript_7832/m.17889 type:complete len:215 (-) Transcript_7832:45-689(-)
MKRLERTHVDAGEGARPAQHLRHALLLRKQLPLPVEAKKFELAAHRAVNVNSYTFSRLFFCHFSKVKSHSVSRDFSFYRAIPCNLFALLPGLEAGSKVKSSLGNGCRDRSSQLAEQGSNKSRPKRHLLHVHGFDVNSSFAEQVVLPSLLRIRQDRISRRNFLEPLLEVSISSRLVGMVLDGKLAICAFDLTVSRTLWHSKDLVEVQAFLVIRAS